MPSKRITFSNAQMFSYVMAREELCRELLERILKIDIERIDYVSVEHEIDPNVEGRGVRLDAYARNATTAFDIEMQAQQEYWLGLRFRYYQGAIDTDVLKKGCDYSELPHSFIIFLCVQDPFGCGLPVYTIEPQCIEFENAPLGCCMRWIVLNGASWQREADKPMRSLLQYVEDGTVNKDDALVSKIDQVVTEANTDEKVMSTMISVSTVEENAERRVRMAKRYYREVGVEEGREIGIKEGREIGLEIGLEEGRSEGRVIGREEGRAEGRAESEALYGRLVETLLAAGRQEDLLHAAQDEAYRASLIDELKLQEPAC